MKIFLSRSFDKKDEEVIEWFKNLITESITGSEVVTARKPALRSIWEKIDEKVHECIAVVGILTKNIKVEGKDEWRTKGWILTELAYGFGRGMPSFAFVEEGVRGLGTIGIKEYISFNRDELRTIRQDAIDYLTSVLIPFKEQTYGFDSYDKRTCVFKNGHGICQTIVTLHVSSDKFSKIRHSFGLGNSARKNLELPSWNKLTTTDIKERFRKPTFFAEILNDFGRRRRLTIEGSPESTNERKVFYIHFRPNLKPGDKIQYGCGWSCPDLFPNRKTALARGKRKGNLNYVESILTARHAVKELLLELSFENGYPLFGSPWMEVVDYNGNLIEKIKFACHNKMYYTVFSQKITPVRWNASYKARWRPR